MISRTLTSSTLSFFSSDSSIHFFAATLRLLFSLSCSFLALSKSISLRFSEVVLGSHANSYLVSLKNQFLCKNVLKEKSTASKEWDSKSFFASLKALFFTFELGFLASIKNSTIMLA